MVFDERKAQYAYKVYTSGDEIFGDVDAYYQVNCNDGLFRFFALEVKHPNERHSGGQLFAISKILNIPILVVTMSNIRSTTKFIDGKITDEFGIVDTTKTAWICADECIIADTVGLPKKYIGMKVSEFVLNVKMGLVPCLPSFPVKELPAELESFRKKN